MNSSYGFTFAKEVFMLIIYQVYNSPYAKGAVDEKIIFM
mgnify:CR=1 FL=1